MTLTKGAITKLIRSALEEFAMSFADVEEMKATQIDRVLQQLKDVSGTNWDPSADVLAGLIVLKLMEKKAYVPDFAGAWLEENAGGTVSDLIDHLHENQISLD